MSGIYSDILVQNIIIIALSEFWHRYFEYLIKQNTPQMNVTKSYNRLEEVFLELAEWGTLDFGCPVSVCMWTLFGV